MSNTPPKLKYAVRPTRDLKSKFEKRMDDKEKAKIEEVKQAKRDEELAAQAVSTYILISTESECVVELS